MVSNCGYLTPKITSCILLSTKRLHLLGCLITNLYLNPQHSIVYNNKTNVIYAIINSASVAVAILVMKCLNNISHTHRPPSCLHSVLPQCPGSSVHHPEINKRRMNGASFCRRHNSFTRGRAGLKN